MKKKFGFIDREILSALLQTALIGIFFAGLAVSAALIARWIGCLVVPSCRF